MKFVRVKDITGKMQIINIQNILYITEYPKTYSIHLPGAQIDMPNDSVLWWLEMESTVTE
jgi:hypothetical protein